MQSISELRELLISMWIIIDCNRLDNIIVTTSMLVIYVVIYAGYLCGYFMCLMIDDAYMYVCAL